MSCCLVGLGVAAGCGNSGGSAQSGTAAQLPKSTTTNGAKVVSFPDLVQRVRSGVVRIEVQTCDGEGIGTGILISPTKVATVEHVVDGAAIIRIKRDGKLLATATVIGDDTARDLALLKTSKPVAGFRFELTNREPRLGESIAVLGYPLGLPLTVTRGSVSGLNRTIPIEAVDRRRLVQIDAAVNPGNSGGPLIIADTGKVVGLVDLGSSAVNGIAFAVSAQVAQPLLAAWQVAPQPIALTTCGTQPHPPPPTAPPTSASLSSYVGQVADILALSASGRGDVGAIVTRVKQGTTYLADGAVQMNGPIANRQEVLQQIDALPASPDAAAQMVAQLRLAIQTSLNADAAYQTWMQNLPDDPNFNATGAFENGDFQTAQGLSADASRAKDTFVSLYNPMARQFGLRTWSGGGI